MKSNIKLLIVFVLTSIFIFSSSKICRASLDEVLYFDLTDGASQVNLFWETGSSLDTLGFNLYRSPTTDEGDRELVNPLTIQVPDPGSVAGAYYEYTDTSASKYYWLEKIDFNIDSVYYGPIENTLYVAPTPTPAPTAVPTPVPLSDASAPSTSGNAFVQIPGVSGGVLLPLIISPIEDSNTNGQNLTIILFPNIFAIDGYLSANHIKPSDITNGSEKTNIIYAGGGDGTILGLKINSKIFWQIGNILDIWYKGVPAPGHDAAKIIPELQTKDSIIVLKYNDAELVPRGNPKSVFAELKLKIAHSQDGKMWTLLNSVVDPFNNSVATIGKVGGYYMIVGGF